VVPVQYDWIARDELDGAPLRTAISPLPTAFTLLRDALQDGRRGTPAVWRRSVISQLRARDVDVFGPLTDRRTTGWPTLLDDVRGPRETLDEALQRLRATSGSALMEALETDRDVTPTPAWGIVRRDPDRWMRGYVDALRRGWRGLEPLWRRSASLAEREVERLDAAVERGVPTAQIVHGLIRRSSLDDKWLRIERSPEPRQLRIDEDGLTVTPAIIPGDKGTLTSPGEFFVAVAYPLPDAWRAFDGQAPPPASIEALLGVRRTALLLALDQAQTAGRLADVLGLAPSAITFHVGALEAAGLVSRERFGRNTIVHRTARGTQLMALYARP
jgi:DNA-binding transcriptional ArsR family regulator